MTFNYDSLLDLDSLPTTDYNVGGNVGNTSPVPDISTTATMQQQQQQSQLLPIDASIFLENENISNEDLFNAFGPLDDDVVKKEPTLQKMLFDGLATPSPGLVNLIMGIDGLQHPAQETVAVVVANVHTPQIASSTTTSLPVLMTSRPRRSSTQHRKYAHSPSPPPPPSAAGKRVKAEPYYGGSTSAEVGGGGGRPIVGTTSIPRAVPRTHKSVPSNPHDIAVLRLFPVELLRSDRDTYKAALQANQAKLSKPQLLRLRALRRKELSCVYADNARHRRIGRMEQLEDQVGNLEAENSALRQQLAQFL